LDSSQTPHIGPEIGYQPFDVAEQIGCPDALKMPMIAFAALIIVPNLPNAGTAIEQRILQAMC
jgi:hypothetical protein